MNNGCKPQDYKVLLISPLPPPIGGIATWTKCFLEEFVKAGLQYSLVNTTQTKSIKSLPALNIFLNSLNFFGLLINALKIYLFDSIDLVHISTSLSKWGIVRDIVLAKSARIFGYPVVVHVHCDIEVIVRLYDHRKLVIHLFQIASEVIVLNKSSEDFVARADGCHCSIIPNFINGASVENKLISSEIKDIIFVGHITKYKGLFELIESARTNPNIRFTLVGSIIQDNLLDHAPDNIFYLGAQSREVVKDLLGDADVFILPSYTEGFSVALLEAMSMGLPIIASDVGANSEMIGDKGGVILENISEMAISLAIKTLKPKKVREAASTHNLHRVNRWYSSETVMKTWLDKYLEHSD